MADEISMNCKICNHPGPHKLHEVREMNLGLKDRFHYVECRQCHCLQLIDPPADMGPYYPETYGPFQRMSMVQKYAGLRGWLIRQRDQYAIRGHGLVGQWFSRRHPANALLSVARARPSRDARILDVGCGPGDLLYSLKEDGFDHVAGIDLFIPDEIHYPNGLHIEKRTLETETSMWDVIMFHHSFEHMSNPLEILQLTAAKLLDKGTCIIRIPVVPCYAWETYGVDWVQIDAPRHYFIHSPESMQILAQAAGLRIREIVYDSTAMQFWGSEQYQNDIPLTAPNSFQNDKVNSAYAASIPAMTERARQLNLERRGDQAAFYLEK